MHICSGEYKILYCEKNNEVVSYVIYTNCRRHVFKSGNKKDYYVIFYYTHSEYKGYGDAKILMETLFRLIDDTNDFYECIAINNFSSIRAAKKIGFKKDGFVKKASICTHYRELKKVKHYYTNIIEILIVQIKKVIKL